MSAFVDGHQQRMSAATLQPGDAVLAISNSGRSKPVVDAVEIARSFGATTIALTRPGTPLAAKAEIVIAVTIPEADDILRPTPSRYAHMAIVDTIATGVAARLGDEGPRRAPPRPLRRDPHRRRDPDADAWTPPPS